ncbi:uncharacterized protein KGF55_002600 [Candida pseudojiufengensis]|uniref:uncharacterized protein n=1 Tax=Candida pseudojiufengensis TaxID=497109 RepID=UPI002225A444|nr:uncharacterized protein KGF55_002600 [Candida pseudojiufengensis]KAI5963720.1 hypothetical protein KGF55_002600 [Candida pseudojiufengensis]
MEKLIYFPIDVLEIIFQQINQHMVLSLMPLHSKFYEIGRNKLYRNIYLYRKDKLMETNSREINDAEKYYEWRVHKDILNDFSKKFTVISSSTFTRNIIKKKMIRNQHIHHLSIEKLRPVVYTGYKLYVDYNAVPTLLKEIIRYFESIDYVSFGSLNNKFDMKNKNCSIDVLKNLEFLSPDYIPGLYERTLFLEKNKHGSFEFLYNNLKSLKFPLEGSTLSEHNDDDDDDDELPDSIELFNQINLFKNLEELHLQFDRLIDLSDSSFLTNSNKLECKLKKLDSMFWAKLRFGKSDYFNTEQLNTLSLYYLNDTAIDEDEYFYQKFEFKELLTNANLANLRTLVLTSPSFDLKSIKVKTLLKLIICTETADDEDAIEIAKLYLKNPTLRLSWWPRYMDTHKYDIFVYSEYLQLYSPEYYQIISCQWPSYFFKSNIISIGKKQKKRRLTSHKQDNNSSRRLDIVLKTEYTIEELCGMHLFETSIVYGDVLDVFKRYEKNFNFEDCF